MSEIPADISNELKERVASGEYRSVEELLRDALDALDREGRVESLLIEGLDAASDISASSREWDSIRTEGLNRLNSDPSQ